MVKITFSTAAFLLICILLVISQSVCGQRPKADSLRALLKKSLKDEHRVDVLNDLSFELYDFEDSAAFGFANLALNEAIQLKYAKGIKNAYTLVGLGYINSGNYKVAIENFRSSERVKAGSDANGVASYNLTLMGNIYRDLAKYDSSKYFYGKALKIIGEKNRDNYLATVYKNLGYIHSLLWENSKALDYLHQAEVIAINTDDTYLTVDIWSSLGRVYENILDFEKAQYYFDRMCAAADKEGDLYHLIKCDLNTAGLSFRSGDFSESLKGCFAALKKSETYYYPPQRVEIYIKIGEVYEELSQYELASKYFFEALKITEKIGLKFETADIYSELAWIYKDQFNFTLALEYVNRSQTIREEIKDRHGIANSYSVRGIIFLSQKRYTEAIRELEKSVEIRKSIGHLEGVSNAIFNLALVYEELNQLSKALDYQLQAVALEEQIRNKQSMVISYNSISSLLIKLGKLDEVEQYLQKARALAIPIKSKVLLRNNYHQYSLLYQARGDYKKAFESQLKYQQLDDSVYSESSATKLAEMQALYQVDQRDQEIKILNQDKQIQEDQIQLQSSRINLQIIIITSIVVGFLLVSMLALYIYRYNRRIRKANFEILEQKEEIEAQSEELIEANQTIAQINKSLESKIEDRTSALRQAYKELDTFFYRSSHDFRRPLTTFMGLAEVAKITVKDTNALELFSKVRETANNLDKMLFKLQSISDVGVQQLVCKEVFLKDMFDAVCDNFRDELNRKNIRIATDIDLPESFYSYPAMIKIIIENLVENAIFFCGVEDPFIFLKIYRSEEQVLIEVQDNGQGIEKEFEGRIFEMYFRGNERSKGNGLGLYIVKKAVEKLGGTISYRTRYGSGSTFTVSLPTNPGTSDSFS